MIFYIVIILLLIFDLWTKYLSKIYLVPRFDIFWDFVYLQYVLNKWIAFWIPLEWIILKIITLLITIWFIIYYFKYEENKSKNQIKFAYMLIFAWAIGNWYERVFNWVVIDFIWIKGFSIFNLADAYLTIWAILYILFYMLNKKNAISR